ncbi:MAG: hypothetical protein RSB69_11625 [Odoribacter sp.]
MEKENKSFLDSILYYGDNEEITVKKLLEFLTNPSKYKEELADFVYNRLCERYIKPFEMLNQNNNSSEIKPKLRLGFSTMANMCLLIETLQSFKEGLKDSNQISENLFKKFFQENEQILGKNNSSNFYKNIRCGILHQGETTDGWRINNKFENPIDSKEKTINAQEFLKAMEKILCKYKKDLKEDEALFKNAIIKIEFIIENCKK